jgi:hypothetical protein
MKRMLLAAAVSAFFISTTQAQISKGALYVGGGISYGSQKTDITQNTGTSNNDQTIKVTMINPAIGIALHENLIAGIELSYDYAKYDQGNATIGGSTQNGKRYEGGFFLRKYLPLAKNLYLFGQGSIGYQRIDVEQTNYFGGNQSTQDVTKGSALNLNLYPGISYAVTKKFYLELALNNLLGVNYEDTKTTSSSPNSSGTSTRNEKAFLVSSSLNNASSFSIGARFIFPKK